MSTEGSSPAISDAGIDLSANFGALALGCVLCTVFWSFLLVQTVYYHAHFSHDAWPSRVVAYTMLIICTAFEVLYLHGLWDTLIIHFGSPTAAIATSPSFGVLTVIDACAALIAQMFYTHRIWQFAHNRAVKWIVPACLVPLILMNFGASAWWSYQVLQFKTMLELQPIEWELYLYFVPAAVADIAIAITLSLLLRRSRTGIPNTDRILRTLTISSLNSGVWPAAFATLALILSVTLPGTLWDASLAYPTVMLYGNSVLGSLNARALLRKGPNNMLSSDSYALSGRINHTGAHGLGVPRLADRSNPVELHELDDHKSGDGPRDFAVNLRTLPV